MSLLIMAASLFALAGMGACLLRRRLEETMPLAVTLMVGVAYVFGLFGNLNAGFYFVLSLSALAFAGLVVRLLRDEKKDLRSCLLTPGAAAMLLAFVWVWLSFRHHMLYEYDEFSHWGTVLRNMMYFDAIPAGVKEANISYTDYPPAVTLFQYVWTRLSGSFNEGDPQRAMNIMILAFLMPAMRAQRWKYWGSALCMAIALFVLPTLFNHGAYCTIYTDVILGCVFFHALYAWFFGPRDRGRMVLTGSSLFLLPLVKEAGLGLGLIALVIIAVDQAKERNIVPSRRLGNICGMVASALVGWLSWKAFLTVHHAKPVWELSSGLPRIWEILKNGISGRTQRTMENFLLALTDANLFEQNGAIHLSLLLWMVLLGACVALALSKADIQQRTRWRRMAILLSIGLGAYLLSLLYVFLFLFRNYEGESLFSFARYLSSYMLPIAGLSLALASETLGRFMRERKQSVELVLMALVMLTASPTLLLERAVLTRERDEEVYESRMNNSAAPWISQVLNPQTDLVYFVSQNNADGLRYYLRLFEWVPQRFQPYKEGWWLMPTTQSVEDTNDWYTETFSTVKAPQDWERQLVEDGYTHVYLDQVDEAFASAYGELFQNPEQIGEDRLYDVIPKEGGVMLVLIEGA